MHEEGCCVPAEDRGGRGKCKACNHPKQDQINEQLVRGVSLRRLEKRFGISHQALADHKRNHLSPALVSLTKEARLEGSARSILDNLEELRTETERILEATRRSGNVQQALSAIRSCVQVLELIAKITGELDERPQVTVNLQQTQEWIKVQAVVLKFVDEKLTAKDSAELSRRLRLLESA